MGLAAIICGKRGCDEIDHGPSLGATGDSARGDVTHRHRARARDPFVGSVERSPQRTRAGDGQRAPAGPVGSRRTGARLRRGAAAPRNADVISRPSRIGSDRLPRADADGASRASRLHQHLGRSRRRIARMRRGDPAGCDRLGSPLECEQHLVHACLRDAEGQRRRVPDQCDERAPGRRAGPAHPLGDGRRAERRCHRHRAGPAEQHVLANEAARRRHAHVDGSQGHDPRPNT